MVTRCGSEGFPKTIKLLLDARKISDGGIGTYVRNLITGLSKRPDIDLTVLVREGEARDEQLREIPQVLTTSGLYSLHEMFRLGVEIPWQSFSLFHTPHFVLPLRIPVPSVVTIHDLNHLYHPERSYYPVIAFPYFVSALARARGIIAVSRQTAREIEQFSWRSRSVAEKVSVIPNGVSAPSESDFGPSSDDGENRKSAMRDSAPYLLSVISTNKPHKGVSDLIAAFAQIAPQHPSLTLVIVGAGTPSDSLIPGHLASRVRLEGLVERRALWRWYREAEAVVVASLQEGFCLPVIEAHAVGVPVVARPVPTLTEVLTADDAVAADMSAQALGEAIDEMMRRKNGKVWDVKQVRLIEHASQYSIAEVTNLTVNCYKQALQRRNGSWLDRSICQRMAVAPHHSSLQTRGPR
jgi:glycosyltransferase involved in cell wall biosynthesis